MIAVVFPLEPFECLVHAEVQVLGKALHIGQHLSVELLAADAADGGILVVHGDVEQVVQLTEDAELRKLGDAREEHELKIRVERLDGRIEVLHCATQGDKVQFLVHHVKQRRVVLIDDERHFPAC